MRRRSASRVYSLQAECRSEGSFHHSWLSDQMHVPTLSVRLLEKTKSPLHPALQKIAPCGILPARPTTLQDINSNPSTEHTTEPSHQRALTYPNQTLGKHSFLPSSPIHSRTSSKTLPSNPKLPLAETRLVSNPLVLCYHHETSLQPQPLSPFL